MNEKECAIYELGLQMGKRYQKVGNIRSFRTTAQDRRFMLEHNLIPEIRMVNIHDFLNIKIPEVNDESKRKKTAKAEDKEE